MMHDPHNIQHALVVTCYAIIAVQFAIPFVSIKKRTKAHWGLAAMFFIFTFCAFCGYISQMYMLPPVAENIALWGLLCCCVVFIITNQARTVLLSLELEQIKE